MGLTRADLLDMTVPELLGLTDVEMLAHLAANPEPLEPKKVATFILNEIPRKVPPDSLNPALIATLLKLRPICNPKLWRAVMQLHLDGNLVWV